MTRFVKKPKNEIGIGPDKLIFRGSKKINEVLLNVIKYNSNTILEKTVSSVKEIVELQDKETVSWVNIDGLHNTQVLEEISLAFLLDNLVIAEVLNTDARPRIVDYENCTLITVKMLQQDPITGSTIVENLSLVLADKVIISFQEKKGDVFEPVRERLRIQKKRIRNGGADYLTFALLDIVVDNYLHMMSILGEKIANIEDSLLINPSENIINEINYFKHELNFLRRSIKPAKEMIFSLAKTDSDYIADSTYIHFKELENNISQANDASDNYREILSDLLNIYHTTISSKLNDIMKFLTVFSVIFIPLTFIAGIYGTNFDYMPELKYKYSYFIMLGIMVLVTGFMLYFFKKKKWF